MKREAKERKKKKGQRISKEITQVNLPPAKTQKAK